MQYNATFATHSKSENNKSSSLSHSIMNKKKSASQMCRSILRSILTSAHGITLRAAGMLITALFFTAALQGQTVETFTTTGAGTWTKPAGVTSVTVECWGGGGAGGAGSNGSGSTRYCGGGGKGGQYSRVVLSYSSASSVIDFSVGAASTGIGNSTFWGSAVSTSATVLALGGNQGGNATTTANGTGATAYTGAGVGVLFSGGDGDSGTTTASGGGGGSAPGTLENGNTGTSNSGGTPPTSYPFTSPNTGVGGIGGASNGTAGSPGIAYSSGGGGGRATGAIGGQGAQGVIRITYTPPATPTISSFTPTTVCADGGATITITGSILSGATNVTIGGQSATITSNTDTQIQATLPAGAVSGQTISVTTPAGTGISPGTLTINAQPASPSGGTKSPNLTEICAGGNVSLSATTAGTGGVGCTDDYIWLIDGTTQGAYTLGSNVGGGAAAGQVISIQGRRGSCTAGTGCTASAYSTLASWTVVAQPAGPSGGTKSPDLASVCTGTAVSLSGTTAGTGGSGCTDDYIWLINGASQGAYSLGSSVGDGATAGQVISIQGRRAGCTSGAGCSGTSYSTLASWTVAAQPAASITTPSGFLSVGETSAPMDANTPVSPATGMWSVFSVPDGGDANDITFNIPNSPTTTITVAGNAVLGEYILRWTVSNPPCEDDYAEYTLTVEEACAGSAGSISSTGQTLCKDVMADEITFETDPAALNTVSYQWYKQSGSHANPGGSCTSAPDGWTLIDGATSGSYTPDASVAGTTSYICCVTGSGNCSTFYTLAGGVWVVTVNQNTAGMPSSNPELCINTAITPVITIATTGATGIGEPSGLPDGVTAMWAADVITISGTPTVSGMFDYMIPLTGGCGDVSAEGSINVKSESEAPTAANASFTDICVNEGGNISLSVSGGMAGTGATLRWYAGSCGGGESIGSGTSLLIAKPASTTTYYVRYEGDCNMTACASVTVNVHPRPTVTFTTAPSGDICKGVNQTYITEEDQSNYSWTFSGVSNTDYMIVSGGTSGVNTVTLKWLTTGSKTVTVNYTDDNGCSAISATSTNNTVLDAPSLTINAPATVCSPATVDITEGTVTAGSVLFGATLSYWSDEAATEDEIGDPTMLGAGTYYIKAENICGTDIQPVTVSVATAQTAVAGPDQPICESTSFVTLAANSPSEGSGTWSVVSGPNTSTAQFSSLSDPAATFTYTGGPGTYLLRWTISNSPCPPSTSDVTITVAPNTVAGTLSSSAEVCTGSNEGTLTLSGNTGSVVKWQYSTDNFNSEIIDIANTSTSQGYSNVSLTTYYRALVKSGVCDETYSNVVTITTVTPPTTANAGSEQTICGSTPVAILSANNPLNGTGAWSIVSGPSMDMGQFSGTSDPGATFTADVFGTYVLRWTISNSPCPPSSSEVTINLYEAPTEAEAGEDQVLCGDLTTEPLGGNTPSVGAGAWSIVSGGTGTFSESASGSSTFTAGVPGTYILKWTTTNGTCQSSADVKVDFGDAADLASVGENQYICDGTYTSAPLGGNALSVGTGAWSIVSEGEGSFSAPSSGSSTFTAVAFGTYVLRWTVTNGPCISTAEITVTYYPLPEASITENNGPVCYGEDAVFTLEGTDGAIVTFTINSGVGQSVMLTEGTAIVTITGATEDITMDLVSITNPEETCTTELSGTSTVEINQATTSVAGGPDNICESSSPSALTLSGASVGGSATTGAWSVISGAGTLSSTDQTETPDAVTYTPAADYYGTVTLRLSTNDPGTACPETFTERTIVIDQAATVSAGTDFSICIEDIAQLSGSIGGAATSAIWSTSGTGTFSSNNPDATYTPSSADKTAGSVMLTYTTNDPAGPCEAVFASISLSFDPLPAASAGGSQNICVFENATVSGATAANGTILWTHDGTGSISGETTLTPTYTSAAGDAGTTVTLTLTVTSDNTCNPRTTSVSYFVHVKAIPTAMAGGSKNICVNEDGTVTGATASNGTILWTHNGEGTLIDENTLTPTYTPVPEDADNDVVLTMTVSNAPCEDATAIYTFHVVGLPTASVTPTGSQHTCQNAGYTLMNEEATAGGTYTTILWTHNGAGSITNGNTLTPTYTPLAADAGKTVTLTLTVSNATCAPATATYALFVDPLPAASAGGSRNICQNGSGIVGGATAANGTILWTHNGDGNLTNETTLTPTYNANALDAGKAIILTMTVTSNNACGTATATATYTMNVRPLPTASAGGSHTICPGTSYMVPNGAASFTNGSILWTHDGAGTLTGANTLTPSYTSSFDDSGMTVTLTLTVTSNNACNPATATATYSINVTNVLTPTIMASGPLSFCTGGSVTLTAGNGTGAFLWSDGQTGSSIEVSHSAGYTVNVPTDANGCASPPSDLTVVREYAPPTVYITGNTEYCEGGSSLLTAHATPGSGTVSSYQWYLNDLIIDEADMSTYMATAPGIYKVVVTNSHGCASISTTP
jgi:hypothetical protein